MQSMQTLGWTIPLHGAERRRWLVGLAYVAFFLALDWISFIRPFQGLNVTPWNPQPALAIALLLWNPRWLALVWLSLVAAELAVRGVPADWFVMLAANGALALVYAAITRVLQHRLGASPSLATRRDLFWLTTIAAGGALVSGTVYLAALAAAR
jgi:two-component system, LuxR family, sensor kinase FixL